MLGGDQPRGARGPDVCASSEFGPPCAVSAVVLPSRARAPLPRPGPGGLPRARPLPRPLGSEGCWPEGAICPAPRGRPRPRCGGNCCAIAAKAELGPPPLPLVSSSEGGAKFKSNPPTTLFKSQFRASGISGIIPRLRPPLPPPPRPYSPPPPRTTISPAASSIDWFSRLRNLSPACRDGRWNSPLHAMIALPVLVDGLCRGLRHSCVGLHVAQLRATGRDPLLNRRCQQYALN